MKPADTATALGFWERWRASAMQIHDPSFSRLCFPWVADWTFLPLAMDAQQSATAYGALQRVGLSDALHALLAQIPASDPVLDEDVAKEWRAAQGRIRKEPSPERTDFIRWTSEHERILRSLFRDFLAHVEAPAHPRHAALDVLRHYHTLQPLPAAVRQRVNEVTFLGGFIVRWGQVCMRHWALRTKQIHPLQTKLREMQKMLGLVQRSSLYSTAVQSRMQEEMGAVQQFLAALLAPKQAVSIWKKDLLGFDKQLNIDPSKSGIWGDVFWELPMLLRDYVKSQKNFAPDFREEALHFIPDDAFKVSSTVVSLAYPLLWPNKWAKAKSRYHKRADAQKADG